jgi:peptide/nickel transport system permease protein
MKLNTALIINLTAILGLYAIAVFADFLAPIAPNGSQEDSKVSYSPPTEVKFSLKKGFYFHPLELQINEQTYERSFRANNSKDCKISFFSAGWAYKFLGLFPANFHLMNSPNCPTEFNLIGTDRLGRDYFSRLLFSLRPGLFTAILGIIIAFPLGIIYGTIAGYKSYEVGETMMRFVEIILSLPTLYLLVGLAALLPPSLSNMQRLCLITIILSLISWAGLARVVRGQILTIRKKEFVQTAKLIGSPEWKIILRELIPQLSTYLIIAVTIAFPSYVLGETTLSFLGLGVNQPDASLGNILSEGRELSNLFLRPWMAIGPSLIIVMLSWCFNSLGDQLRDNFDVKTDVHV